MLGKMFGTHHDSIFKSFPTPPWLLFFLYHAVFNNLVFAYANSGLMYVFLTMDVNKYPSTTCSSVLFSDPSNVCPRFKHFQSWCLHNICCNIIQRLALVGKHVVCWCNLLSSCNFLWNSHSFKCQNDKNILMYSEWVIYLNVCYMSSQLI